MSGIQFSHWIDRGRRVLRVLGTFDGHAAIRLLEEIRRARERDLVVDVALVRGLDEVGLATLARLAGGGDRRIALRGLSSRQQRILRYLGAELAAL
jgi:anti-anti-sigma regulatory factor